MQLRSLSRRRNHAPVERARLRRRGPSATLSRQRRRDRQRGCDREQHVLRTNAGRHHGLASVTFSVNGSVTTVLRSACDASSVLPNGTLLSTMRALPRYLLATRLMSAAVTACVRGYSTRKLWLGSLKNV